MDEQVMTVKRLSYIYGCSTKTAAKYIRQMKPYMENPISAKMEAFREWEAERTVFPEGTSRKRREELITKTNGRVHVPRKR